MENKYTIDEFIKIIERLRDKDGCPWDKVQTHQSLRPCMMEEAAELVASIRIYDRTGNAENMREELGDILLQVIMHSVIAEEEEIFTFEEVVDEVAKKMIYRHPHVFGNDTVYSQQEQLEKWEELKKKEKEGKEWITSPLRDIPLELPALTRASKISKKLDQVYHKSKTTAEELKVLRDTISKLENEKEYDINVWENVIAEMLLSLSNISSQKRISAEQILNDKIEQIIEKYEPKP